MSRLRFFTDEDIYAAIAQALRKNGLDAVSTPALDRRCETDESQLRFAAAAGRVLVTFNVAHFAALHTRWMDHHQSHAGIVVSSQRSVGDLLQRLLRLSNALEANDMVNQLHFLGNW